MKPRVRRFVTEHIGTVVALLILPWALLLWAKAEIGYKRQDGADKTFSAALVLADSATALNKSCVDALVTARMTIRQLRSGK